MQIAVTRTIAAPIERVFHTIADINEFSKALPHIVNVEFLGDQRSGLGCRFRETRIMRGKQFETELEVTEYVANDHVRMVAEDAHSVWDTVFTVRPCDDGAELNIVMDARAKKFTAKVLNSIIKPMVRKAVQRDIDLVKAFCEQQG